MRHCWTGLGRLKVALLMGEDFDGTMAWDHLILQFVGGYRL